MFGPSESPCGGGFKPPHAALANDCRGERLRKRRCKRRQVGIRKTNASESLLKCRKILDDIKTGVFNESREEPGGCPLIGQAVSGMKTT